MSRKALTLVLALLVVSLLLPIAVSAAEKSVVTKGKGAWYGTSVSSSSTTTSQTCSEAKLFSAAGVGSAGYKDAGGTGGMIPDALQPLVDVFGGRGLADIYLGYSLFWDSVLALVIFIGIAMHALKKMPKSVSATFGVVLAISFSVFEVSTGWRLTNLAPIAFLVILALLCYLLYSLFNGLFGNKTFALAVAWLLAFWVLMPPHVKAWLSCAFPKGYGILALVTSVMLIMAIIGLFRMIAGKFGGGGGLFGGGNSGGGSGGHNGGHGTSSALSDLAGGGKTALDRAATDEKKRQELEKMARDAAALINKEMEYFLKHLGADAKTKRGAAEQLLKYLQQLKGFVEKIHDEIEPNVGKESYKAYAEALPAYKQQLEQYFQAVQNARMVLEGMFDETTVTAMSNDARNQIRDVHNPYDLHLNRPITPGRPSYGVGNFAAEMAVYDGWIKRRSTVLSEWMRQSNLRRTIGSAIRNMKDRADFTVQVMQQEGNSFDVVYKIEDVAKNIARQAQELIEKTTVAEANAATLNMNKFGDRMKASRDANELLGSRINAFRQRMGGLRSKLLPVQNMYQDLDAAFIKRERIIQEWMQIMDRLEQGLDAAITAIPRYVEEPSRNNYRAADVPLTESIKDAERVIEHLDQQAALDQTVIENMQKLRAFEADPEIRSIIQQHFTEIVALITTGAEAIDTAALLFFEVQAYALMWQAHPNNRDPLTIPSLSSPNNWNTFPWFSGQVTPHEFWLRCRDATMRPPTNLLAQTYGGLITRMTDVIAGMTGDIERLFTEYRKVATRVDGLFESAMNLGTSISYKSPRQDTYQQVIKDLDTLRNDWAQVQQALQKVSPPP